MGAVDVCECVVRVGGVSVGEVVVMRLSGPEGRYVGVDVVVWSVCV